MEKNLLHYEIESHLGAGGMGDVYQARDTKLGRSVAIKVLPEIFARDEARVARFEREAKVLASLNHPHIAALYGFEQSGDKHFLIMELVDGETLSEWIHRGSIPVEEALRLALETAEALEAAHEKGVIHRDLKPSNVKITSEGKVKVLDFGLAKALEGAPAATNPMNSPTLSMAATNAGVILGTAGYMSPEQAKGQTVDHRSDIFSFGCVLYEMLTGRQTFEGDSVTEVIASVLKQEPDLARLPSNIHPRVVDLLRRCLAKDAKRRWHAVADVRVEIETILAESRGLQTAAAVERGPLWKRMLPAAVTGIVVAAVTAGVVWNLRPAPAAAITRFTYVLPDGQALTRTGRHGIAISPNGANVAYVADNQLYLRAMSDLEARPLQGTAQDINTPFFSPDGLWVGFYVVPEGKFKKVAITGGAAVTICDAANPYGANWVSGDVILFGQGSSGIMRVSANGGKAGDRRPGEEGGIHAQSAASAGWRTRPLHRDRGHRPRRLGQGPDCGAIA
ncbi:MAG: protein kinase [Acidobacteria bacterium]|nr:protein kinase [Acidobacteriota bacterium]